GGPPAGRYAASRKEGSRRGGRVITAATSGPPTSQAVPSSAVRIAGARLPSPWPRTGTSRQHPTSAGGSFPCGPERPADAQADREGSAPGTATQRISDLAAAEEAGGGLGDPLGDDRVGEEAVGRGVLQTAQHLGVTAETEEAVRHHGHP